MHVEAYCPRCHEYGIWGQPCSATEVCVITNSIFCLDNHTAELLPHVSYSKERALSRELISNTIPFLGNCTSCKRIGVKRRQCIRCKGAIVYPYKVGSAYWNPVFIALFYRPLTDDVDDGALETITMPASFLEQQYDREIIDLDIKWATRRRGEGLFSLIPTNPRLASILSVIASGDWDEISGSNFHYLDFMASMIRRYERPE